jgi:hypothetical protein
MASDQEFFAIVNMAVDGNLDDLWKEIAKHADKDPAYTYIENIAAHHGWGREKFATVLAAALLVRSEDWRKGMTDILAMIPPKPIVVNAPGLDHQGPGC